MSFILRVTGVLLCVFCLCACRRGQGSSANDASDALEKKLKSVDVSAPYVATLMNRLEVAAQPPVSGDTGLVEGALKAGAVPDWLRAYRSARQRWVHGPYFEHVDASFVAHLRCGYFDNTIEELLVCLKRVLPVQDHNVVERAVREMDKRLRSRWPTMATRLNALGERVEGGLRSTASASLIRRLRRLVGLTPYAPFDFRVVLVAAPTGSARLGRREERVLIVEVDPAHTWVRSLATVFHELAHYAEASSPHLVEMEQEFASLGDYGVIAGNYGNEVFATAFEQLAASTFDPNFSIGQELYGDEVVDALARALFLSWQNGAGTRLGAPFAQRLSDLTKQYWPRARWKLAHLLFRVLVMADDIDALNRFRAEAQVHSFWGIAPLPKNARRPESVPPSVPALYLLTPTALSTHPFLKRRWGLSDHAVRTQLAAGKYLFRSNARNGDLALFASTPSSLGEVTSQLAQGAHHFDYPSTGWSAPED